MQGRRGQVVDSQGEFVQFGVKRGLAALPAGSGTGQCRSAWSPSTSWALSQTVMTKGAVGADILDAPR